MRRIGNLYNRVISLENLWQAWRDFRKGKRNRPSVTALEPDADRIVVRLHRELSAGNYRPGGYRLFFIAEPKTRLIAAAAPRDRIVHHAIHRVLAPRLDPSLIFTTFACLKGRGSHRAALCFLKSLRTYPSVLLLDIAHFFPTIDRNILMTVMERRIKDGPLLQLLRMVAESGNNIYELPFVKARLGFPAHYPPHGCGLPIGNLTSQWWGNHYLSEIDHFIKRDLKVPAYIRYMDDMAVFGNSGNELLTVRRAIQQRLAQTRRLNLKNPYAQPRPTTQRFHYLGFTVKRAGIIPAQKTLKKMRRRLRILAGTAAPTQLEASVSSYQGIHAFLPHGSRVITP